MIEIKESILGEGITVGELMNFLDSCPRDAKVLLNHKVKISNPDGSYSVGWVFDSICEAKCEEIQDKERYPEWKVNDKLVWLTHNYE